MHLYWKKCPSRRLYARFSLAKDPSIHQYFCHLPLSKWLIFHHPPTFKQIVPQVRAIRALQSSHRTNVRKVFSFKNLKAKRSVIVNNTPPLFGQHSQVNAFKVFKPQTSIQFRITHRVPSLLVYFTLVSCLSPPKSSN